MRMQLKKVKLFSCFSKCIGLLLMSILLTSVAVDASAQAGGSTKKVTYRGTVIDDLGEPLPGATIVVKNVEGAVGTTTKENGEFSITLDADKKYLFVISYIGMKTQEVRASEKKMTIRLESDAVAIQETVVTGIYTRNIESFTGSVTTFAGEDLKLIGPQNVLKSLSMLDPSVIITENNLQGSNPNAKMDIAINGKMTVTELGQEYESDPNQPLFILDGFESSLQAIQDLNMDRVESISILKDASLWSPRYHAMLKSDTVFTLLNS